MDKITVSCGIICDNDQSILMVKEYRSDEGHKLNQPVGGLQVNESLFDAAIRECYEETGYIVKITSLLGVYTWGISKGETSIRICFIGEITGGNIKAVYKDSDGTIIEPIWIEKNKILTYKDSFRNPVTEKCLTDYLEGVMYSSNIIVSV